MGIVKINNFDASRASEMPVNKNSQTFGSGNYWNRLEVQRTVAEASSVGVRKLKFFGGEGAGEIFNTFMTAFGTAIVAPFFIVWNPFAKEDKETRKYSAWRQPISAAIAIAFQYTVNKSFNSFYARKASLGELDAIDLRIKPRESYLTSKIKKEAKKAGEKLTPEQIQKRIDEIRTALFDDAVVKSKQEFGNKPPAYKDLVEPALYSEYQKKVNSDKGFLQTLENLSKQQRAEKIDERIFSEAAKDVRSELVRRATQNQYILQMQGEIDAGRAGDFNQAYKNIKKQLTNNYLQNPLRQSEHQNKIIAKKQLRVSAMELIDGNEFHTPELSFKKSIDASLNRYYLSYKKQLDNLQIALANAQKEGGVEFVKNSGSTFKEILTHEKIRKFVKVNIKKTEARFGKYNKSWGIVVSLVTLPFSCGLLNWAYPRVMEYIMPETVKAKKQRHEQYYYPASTKVKPSDLKDNKAEVVV